MQDLVTALNGSPPPPQVSEPGWALQAQTSDGYTGLSAVAARLEQTWLFHA